MTDSTRAFARILAYIAALSLIAVSCFMNILAGISKSETLPGQITWGAASAASDILKAVAPLFIAFALAQRDLARVLAAVLVLLTTGSYSIVSAITYSHGARLESASTNAAGADAHERATAQYRSAQTALAALPSTKPLEQLKAEIAGALALPGVGSCTAIDGPVSRKVCPVVAELRAEFGRAGERERLQLELQTAAAKLDSLGPIRPGDPATDALLRVAAQFGLVLNLADVALWLSLSGVILIEVGSTLGLLLASGSHGAARRGDEATKDEDAAQRPAEQALAPIAALSPHDVEVETTARVPSTQPAELIEAPRKRGRPRLGTAAVALAKLEAIAVNRKIETSQATLGAALGMPKATAHRELKRLAAAGAVRLATCARGTTVHLL